MIDWDTCIAVWYTAQRCPRSYLHHVHPGLGMGGRVQEYASVWPSWADGLGVMALMSAASVCPALFMRWAACLKGEEEP